MNSRATLGDQSWSHRVILCDDIMDVNVIHSHQLDIRVALEACSIVRGFFEEELLDCHEAHNPQPLICNDSGKDTQPASLLGSVPTETALW